MGPLGVFVKLQNIYDIDKQMVGYFFGYPYLYQYKTV